MKLLKRVNPAQYKPSPDAVYPRGAFGDRLRQVAQLIKSDIGLEIAFTDIGGWDTHANQGSSQGQLALRLTEFAQAVGSPHRSEGTRRRRGDPDDDRIRPHSARKRQPRHRSWPRQRDVRARWPGQRRQGLRQMARLKEPSTIRRPRPGGHHRFPRRLRRTREEACLARPTSTRSSPAIRSTPSNFKGLI